jgi:Ni,Fe-hydrogenase III large subunit/Ni,Fe-hydrogenase III component G
MRAAIARREVALAELRGAVLQVLEHPGWRFCHQTARLLAGGEQMVEVLLLHTGHGSCEILAARLPQGSTTYPSLTPQIPAAHWAERATADLFGLRAEGHPRWKSLLLHEAWPADFAPLRDASPESSAGERPTGPYAFLEVHGEGVHEIPVGPIHAGIIEPGHFRFSCLGEVITNLEIRLGYQHRGVERRLAEIPWRQGRFVAEAASSDTAVGNALAHAVALEQLLGVEPPPRANALRSLALEIERLASHLGDLGGLSADIGYSAGAALFARLRGSALGLGELLTGNRLQRGYVAPGGVTRDLDSARHAAFRQSLTRLMEEVPASLPLLLEHSPAVERMEGTGRLPPALAREFGLVGPAARASGSDYDVRAVCRHGLYPEQAPAPARREAGDVLARAQVRAEEIVTSLSLLARWVDALPVSPVREVIDGTLPANQVGLGIVEAWRGELVHWISTDGDGNIQRYAIKDPSFNNWTGLAIAVRGNVVADFPLCNKSFNLSYSGNDL